MIRMRGDIKAKLRLSVVGLLMMLVVSMGQAQTATLLTLEETATGSFDEQNIADVYIFVSAGGDTVSVQASSESAALGLLLTDIQGTTLAESVGEVASTSTLTGITLSQTGSYLLTVFAVEGAGDYDVTLQPGVVEAEAATAEPVVDAVEAEPTVVEATDEPTPDAAQPTDTVDVQPTNPPAAQQEVLSYSPPQDVLLNGGIDVSLQWAEAVDLNLEVRDPFGNTLFFDSRTSPINGSFGFDANGLCEVISNAPEETATWSPGFLPSGSYEILVFYRQACEGSGSPTVDFTIDVSVNGNPQDTINGSLSPPFAGQNSVYIASFTIEPDGTASVNPGGFYPDSSIGQLSRPPQEILSIAEPINFGEAVTGSIVGAQDLLAYSFQAEEGDIVTISMSNTSGSLDTLLQLVDQNGNVIAFNDDASVDTRDSQITGQLLPATGTYTVVATHYGKEFGATEGTFELLVSTSGGQLPAELAALGLPDGDIEVYLTWNTNHDLQLLVRDPVGFAVFDDAQAITSGGRLVEDGFVNCDIENGAPLSYIYWPLGRANPGVYEIEVWFQSECADTSIAQFTLTTVVNGEVISVQQQNPVFQDRFVQSFEILADGSVQVGPGGFIGSASQILDLESAGSVPIQFNQPVNGSINQQNAFDVFTFDAALGDVLNINMRQVSGNLDTNLLLLDPNGIEVASNDDADPNLVIGDTGRTTDSLINAFTVTTPGTYRIVATRFGTIYGGTTGNYTLTLNNN